MKENLGQFFTTNKKLQQDVFSLVKNSGRFLEPSAGKGHLVSCFKENGIKNIVSIEIDTTLNNKEALPISFFDYPIAEKFDTIFGNPPYVKYNKIGYSVDSLSKNCNLYLYFIEKCFYHLNDGGEMIFIVPRELFNSTRGAEIRKLLYDNGTITDVIDYEEQVLFEDACPYVITFRYEKGNLSHVRSDGKKEYYYEGSLIYLDNFSPKKISDYFNVYVGIVSGLNEVFEYDCELSIPIICSDYLITKKKRKFVFTDMYSLDVIKKYDFYAVLKANKSLLINRKVKKFDESNWWKWGAVRNLDKMGQKGKAIYVNQKTRNAKPFFIEKKGFFDGSILALYPKDGVAVEDWIDILNNSADKFKQQNMLVGNKFIFTQKTLSDFILY